MKRATIFLLIAPILAGCGNLGSPPTLVQPYIVFSSTRTGNEEIYRVDSNGNYLQRLTSHVAQDHQPAFSQANDKIVFASERDGDDEIFVMDTDGANLTQLTSNTAEDNCPRFTFDGTK